MFRGIGLQINSGLKPAARHPHRVFHLVLVIAFLIGSAGQTATAGAASAIRAQNSATYILAVYLPDPPICVGKDYEVRVRLVESDQVSRAATGVLGVNIDAFAQDENIGTLSPPSKLAFDVFAESYELGTVTFTFRAKKAGTTTLFFETSIYGEYLSSRKNIKVVNCDYKVSMNIFAGAFGDVSLWTSGFMNTKITGDGYQMQGSGSLSFISGFTGPPCSISYTDYENKVTITGISEEANETLRLKFEFQGGTVTSSVSCPGLPNGQGSQAVDLTNLGIPEISFPASGGSATLRSSYAGSDFPAATIIITVAPVEANE